MFHYVEPAVVSGVEVLYLAGPVLSLLFSAFVRCADSCSALAAADHFLARSKTANDRLLALRTWSGMLAVLCSSSLCANAPPFLALIVP